MKSISIFCGSSDGKNPIFKKLAFSVGAFMAKEKISLVYGGAKIGLMGAVAEGALQNGGEVIGVIPEFLTSKEIVHKNLSELIIVETMHERKTKMHELSDGVIVLAGGFGTLEECFEMLTWGQLGLHRKPVGLLNSEGFYNGLIDQLQSMVDQLFLKQENMDMLLIADEIGLLIDRMKHYQAPELKKWITKETT